MKKLITFLIIGITILGLFIWSQKEVKAPVLEVPIDNMEVHFVNMGRNDAFLIRTNDKVIAIDGGSYRDGDIFVNYLKDLGITHINVLIGSHIHFNHIQSHAKILRNFTVDRLYYPHELELCKEEEMCDYRDIRYIMDEVNYQNKTINIMRLNDILEIGEMIIEVIGPTEFGTFVDHRWPQNFNSLNFILTFGNTRFFFTGDGMQEANIMEQFSDQDLKVDVFQHPHHGEEILSREFIEMISPRYVVETNSNSQLLSENIITGNLFQNIGATHLYFNTSENIIFISDGENIQMKRKTLQEFIAR